MSDDQFPSIAAGTQVDHGALYHFGARHSLVVNEAQEQFAAWLGDADDWQVDLVDGILDFGSKQVKIQLLGSHSYESDTWLWAWGNSGYADPRYDQVLSAARWLRDESPHREQAWQLRTRLFPVGEQLSQGGVACWPLHYAAFTWLGARAIYSADYGQGRFFVTIHDEALPRPQADPVTLPQLVTDAVEASGLDARTLLESYAAWHRLSMHATDQGLQLSYPGGSEYQITLDEQGRATNFKGTLAGRDTVQR